MHELAQAGVATPVQLPSRLCGIKIAFHYFTTIAPELASSYDIIAPLKTLRPEWMDAVADSDSQPAETLSATLYLAHLATVRVTADEESLRQCCRAIQETMAEEPSTDSDESFGEILPCACQLLQAVVLHWG